MLLDKREQLVRRAAVILSLAATEYQFYAVKPSLMGAAALILTIKDLSVVSNANVAVQFFQMLAEIIGEEKV